MAVGRGRVSGKHSTPISEIGEKSGSSGILVAKGQGPDHRSGTGLQVESCSCYETASRVLDPLDLGVDRFSGSIGYAMLHIGDDGLESSL
jgi:hypothetical protein